MKKLRKLSLQQLDMLMTTMVIPLLVPMKSCVYAETVAEIQLHRIYNA